MARRRRPHPDPYAPRRFEPLEEERIARDIEYNRPARELAARRHGRVSIPITPVTHVISPRRGRWDRDDDPPVFFQVPAPGFSGTEDEHTKKGNHALQHAEVMAVAGANRATKGDCVIARHELNEAHRAVGAAVAHSASGGRLIGTSAVTDTVDRAEEHFGRTCRVTRRRK